MKEGTIVGLTDKGFGFIHIEGQEKDVFFHARELVDVQYDDLQKGDAVRFEIEEDQKGQHAVGVTKAQ